MLTADRTQGIGNGNNPLVKVNTKSSFCTDKSLNRSWKIR